jgi:hypothetical protein
MATIKRSQLRQLVREMVRSSLRESTPPPAGEIPQEVIDSLLVGMGRIRDPDRVVRPYVGQHQLSFSLTADGRTVEITNVESSEWDPRRRDPAGQERSWRGRVLPGHASPAFDGHFRELKGEIHRAVEPYQRNLARRGSTMGNGRYVLNYEVSPSEWPDQEDPLAREREDVNLTRGSRGGN